jgi:hypothetical protein
MGKIEALLKMPSPKMSRQGLVIRLVAVVVLAHLVHEGYNTQYKKSEQAYHGQCCSPCMSVIKTFDEQHGAKNGENNGYCKKWDFHYRLFFN